MFDVSWGKLVIIGVVALLVIGPKELPTVLRTVGQWMGKIRRMAAEFQGQFQDAMREAEMADLKKQFDDTTSDLQSAFDPTKVTSDVEKLVGDPLNPQNDSGAASTTATPGDASDVFDRISRRNRARYRAACARHFRADARPAAAARDEGFRRYRNAGCSCIDRDRAIRA